MWTKNPVYILMVSTLCEIIVCFVSWGILQFITCRVSFSESTKNRLWRFESQHLYLQLEDLRLSTFFFIL